MSPLSVLPERDRLRIDPGHIYIGGEWVDSVADERRHHVNPATNEETTTIAAAGPEDVDRAVAAACAAFDQGAWPRLRARERRVLLAPLVDAPRGASPRISRIQTIENGAPFSRTRPRRWLHSRPEAVRVCQPQPLAITDLIAQLDLPPGVFNVVTGVGATAGEALVTHPGVDKISFTGSRRIGRHILAASGKDIKRVTLELGGKSPAIVFPDAPDVAAAGRAVMGMIAFGMSGQTCTAQTRAMFLDGERQTAESVRFGDPFDRATTSAPLINQVQMEKVLDYIRDAPTDGARLLLGGGRPGGDLAAGNFVNPAVFTDVDNRSSLAQEEVFGPVLAVMRFRDEDEAVRLANDVAYGLSAGIFTREIARAFRVGRRLRTGAVAVNSYTFMPHSPIGGYKASGLGRERGRAAVDAYTETKTTWQANASRLPPIPTPLQDEDPVTCVRSGPTGSCGPPWVSSSDANGAAPTACTERTWRAYATGVMPCTRLNQRPRWAWSEKPAAKAASPGGVPRRSKERARSRRARTRKECGVVPSVSRKRRTRTNLLTPATFAVSSSVGRPATSA